jgi:hypothetical protein
LASRFQFSTIFLLYSSANAHLSSFSLDYMLYQSFGANCIWVNMWIQLLWTAVSIARHNVCFGQMYMHLYVASSRCNNHDPPITWWWFSTNTIICFEPVALYNAYYKDDHSDLIREHWNLKDWFIYILLPNIQYFHKKSCPRIVCYYLHIFFQN